MRGQASIEYVVVVALVVAVTAVVSTVAAPGIANDIGRALRRALCLVGGGDCLATERQPCVTTTDGRAESVTVDLAVIHAGHKAALLRRELSDGTVLVTLLGDLSAGVEVGFGAHGRLQIGGIDVAGGGQLQAAALARLGKSRTFVAKDGPAADRLVDRLLDGAAGSSLIAGAKRAVGRMLGRGDALPDADSETYGAGAEGEVSASLRGFPMTAETTAALKASFGGSVERGTGRRTLFFKIGGETAGALQAVVGQGRLGGQATVALGVTYSRDGTPLVMTVSLEGDAAGRIGALNAMPGVPAPQAAAGRRVEIDATLDLGRAENAQLAQRLVGSLDARPRPGDAAAAVRDLGARFVREGDVDVRAYDTSSRSQGIGGGIAAGAKLGADVDVSRSSSRLRAAWSRPAGGVWERRIDCAPGAVGVA